MGAGSLLEIVARGEQDKYNIGNPQITFFKTVYKRHTNFSMESMPQYFMEQPDFGKRVSCIIDRRADLLSELVLEIDLPPLEQNVSWINAIGHTMIKTVELTIGGEVIVSMTGEYLDIDSELTVPSSQRNGYYKMISKTPNFSRTAQSGALHMYVPLPFWFCRDLGRVLPLIAMQYSEIRINVEFKPFNECWYSGTSMSIIPAIKHITNAILYCDYIYLDTFERTKFATMPQLEYMIEQVQLAEGNSTPSNNTLINADVFFNHPVKELLWIYQADDVVLTNDWLNFSLTLDNDTTVQIQEPAISACKLRLNGQDRFELRNGDYFRLVQPYQRHTTSPDNFVYSYSFAIHPEDPQPSGSCNFSKIDNTILEVLFNPGIPAGQIRVYAINMNILKIKNGMTGLMFSD